MEIKIQIITDDNGDTKILDTVYMKRKDTKRH